MSVNQQGGGSSSPTINKVVKENYTNGVQKGTTTPSPADFKNKHPVKK